MKFLEKLAQLFKEEVPVVEVKPVELKKRTKKLVEKKEVMDLGVTTVRLTFQDGRELMTRVYGSFRVDTDFGSDEGTVDITRIYGYYQVKAELREPSVKKEIKSDSLTNAETYISEVELVENRYVDDPRKPTVSFVGKVISAQIIKTEQCLEEVTKYSVEPV